MAFVGADGVGLDGCHFGAAISLSLTRLDGNVILAVKQCSMRVS